MAKLIQLITLFFLQLYFLCSNIPILNAYHLCRPDQSLSLINFKHGLQIDTYKTHCRDYVGINGYVVLSSYCDRYNNPIIDSKISSWNGSTDCCSWDGVTCDEFTGKVIELDLSSSRIEGVIDSNSSIFQLSHLKRLNLAYSILDGSEISPILRKFTHLSHLNLTRSGFQGEIPSEITRLYELVSIDLSDNDELSLEPHVFKVLLQNMTRLRELSLSFVNIGSSLPDNITSSLTLIDLAYTYLKGKFPYHIFYLPNLQQLSLSDNPFDGFISLRMVKLNASSSLKKLELYQLDLSEGLPDTIGNLKRLAYLDLSHCELMGTLPHSFGNLTQLSHLGLSGNQFSGQILQEIVGLEHLTFLDIGYTFLDIGNNDLDDPTPHPASNNLKRLKTLSLIDNKLTSSSVSSFLRNLTQLEAIDLSYNPLHQIPLTIFDLLLLQYINLEETHTQGQFPKSFSKLVNLRYLNLQSNNVSGPFETKALSNLVNLRYINLGSNNFSGIVDVKSLRSFKRMDVLDLSLNSLTLINEDGTTFPFISINSLRLGSCNIRDLNVLRSIVVLDDLSLPNNNIHGEIPEWVWSNWSNVTSIDLSNNFLTHIGNKIPLQRLLYLNLESNLLQGLLPILPHSFGILSLANNKFHGEIKSSIYELRRVGVLNLSNNSLSGALPNSVGGLLGIRQLNLSHNKFTGHIPPQLGNLSNLLTLDLSYNHLTGRIPSGQQLQALPNDSYIGNDGLCGFPLSRNCGNDNPSMLRPPQGGLPDDEDDQEFFDGFTWQSVLVGYGVGICVGFVIGNLMLFSEKPKWLIRIVKEEADKIIYKYKSRNGINQTWFRRS